MVHAIDRLKKEIKEADAIVIGAGAGMSTAAGFTYSGERFENIDELAEEWAQLTFGDDEQVISAVSEILKGSHKSYEDYTVPLGLGWMCKPNHHYGPDPWGYEFDRWGTYNRADREAVCEFERLAPVITMWRRRLAVAPAEGTCASTRS